MQRLNLDFLERIDESSMEISVIDAATSVARGDPEVKVEVLNFHPKLK